MIEYNGMHLDLPQMTIKAPSRVSYPKQRYIYQEHELAIWAGVVALALLAWFLLLCNHAYLLWQISGMLMRIL